jgi:thioredoxin reductase
MLTTDVENYPFADVIMGPELMTDRKQAQRFGAGSCRST